MNYKSADPILDAKQLARYRQLDAQRRGLDQWVFEPEFSKPYAFTEKLNELRSLRENDEKKIRALRRASPRAPIERS